MKPRLTVCVITYNQEKFITEALNSIVEQKTNFEFVIIVSDDCSTDNTYNICSDFEKIFEKKIILKQNKNNLGVIENFRHVLSLCDTEFVALCEGDDYWTDPFKLQKQVDLLDKNLDCTVCFHPVNIIDNESMKIIDIFPDKRTYPFVYKNKSMNINELIEGNFIQTNSVVYRWLYKSKDSFLNSFPKSILPCDWFLHLLHAKEGHIIFLNEIMGVYRKNIGSVWYSNIENMYPFYKKNGIEHIQFFIEVEKTFKETSNNVKFYNSASKFVFECMYSFYRNTDIQRLTHLHNEFNDFTLKALTYSFEKINDLEYQLINKKPNILKKIIQIPSKIYKYFYQK